uniref:Uncharacterized protein n=1 Tax=Tetraselmis sp. GSL018 TaxID=582737 RepID=A0A061R879_9CHLO|mmetsp:Transcript_26864/g.63771  ORF Transcript_26864/g.63771 Transcript_26864/m.63771 type:complete len:105 (-) Transcript_26864:48-362(-)
MPESISLPRGGPPAETRNLSKSSESACKKKVAPKKGYQAPNSREAQQERALRAPNNPIGRAFQGLSDKVPPNIRNGVGQAFSGFGNTMQRLFGGSDGVQSGRRF